jgi:hypothetical protein
MRFTGKLLRDGQVIAEPVSGNYDIYPGAVTRWEGEVEIPEGVAVSTGAELKLVLPDGRSGRIRVLHTVQQPGSTARLKFKGVGLPP